MSRILIFGEMHLRGMSAGSVCGNVRGDGILPQAKPHKDVRWHVQGVCRVRRDGCIAAGSFKTLGCEFRAGGCVNQVMRDSRMIRILLQQGLENRDGLFLVRNHIRFVSAPKCTTTKSTEN